VKIKIFPQKLGQNKKDLQFVCVKLGVREIEVWGGGKSKDEQTVFVYVYVCVVFSLYMIYM
jgi:hypothetical protein